ncbi:hypothetical protein [Novosphingobium sp. THN1]|uniref:hypothetical protein n=1 Tax=Novosphingobium sp. THN1 TaxID=1016987 RepID=UPI000E474497|nr:hypothetical protein [Novosphingobium sp. THN1]
MSDQARDPAMGRYFALQAVRASGAVLVLLGVLVQAGKGRGRWPSSRRWSGSCWLWQACGTSFSCRASSRGGGVLRNRQ